MAEAVLGAFGRGDPARHVGDAHDADHRHEQLVLHERMLFGYLGDREAAVIAHPHADLLQNHRSILANPLLVGVISVEDHFFELCQLAIAEQETALADQPFFEVIADRGDRENLLFIGANDVVIERRPGGDAARRDLEVRRLVDHDGWVAGAAADRALARCHRLPDHARPAGDDEDADPRVLHELLRALDGGFVDAAQEIAWPADGLDRLV